jgi:MoxR-like ATPase
MSPEAASAVSHRAAQLETALRKVIRGKDDIVRLAVVSLLARGHLLIEGVPGVGKTTLGQAIARVLDCTFQRVQFTSDMLPSDVLGISIYSAMEQQFEFKRGPVFTNVLLADEINRTTPKTQSALLEAMNEGQVTVDAHSYPLPQPFLVIATQNPVEHHGTYPLPESQLDRFLMRVRMGYPDSDAEREILRSEAGSAKLEEMQPVLSGADLLEMIRSSATHSRLSKRLAIPNISLWGFHPEGRRCFIARRRQWPFSMGATSVPRRISSR